MTKFFYGIQTPQSKSITLGDASALEGVFSDEEISAMLLENAERIEKAQERYGLKDWHRAVKVVEGENEPFRFVFLLAAKYGEQKALGIVLSREEDRRLREFSDEDVAAYLKDKGLIDYAYRA